MRVSRLKITETQLHATIADLLSWTLLPPAVWTTFPAGWGKIGKATAGQLNRCGLAAGWPDILIIYNGTTIGIELKTEDGHLSKAQKDMFPRLEAAGVQVYVCRNAEEVIAVLRSTRIPMREFSLGHTQAKARRAPQPDAGTPAT